MPYIVTTITPGNVTFDGVGRIVPVHGMTAAERESFSARYEVATLEQARGEAQEVIRPFDPDSEPYVEPPELTPLYAAAENIPESGGTIGPLPDGTVIEVAWAEWIDVGIDPFDAEVDAAGSYSVDSCNAAIDAYNAAQAGTS